MKVYPFKIPKPKDERLIVQIDKDVIFYNRLHQHEEIQISLIVSGNGKLLVGDSIHSFSKGDIFVIGGNLPHLFQSVATIDDAHMISVFCTETTYGKGFFNIPDFADIQSFFKLAKSGFKVLSNQSKIATLLHQISQEEKLNRFITFLQLLDAFNYTNQESLTTFISSKEISSNEGERLQVIFDFLFNNFQKPIQLKEVSDMAFMTPTAFCRFFKQRTNKTFFEFLIELRVAHACQLLTTDHEIKINEISDICGFNTISNFNKKFKKIKGLTPTEYKKQQKIVP